MEVFCEKYNPDTSEVNNCSRGMGKNESFHSARCAINIFILPNIELLIVYLVLRNYSSSFIPFFRLF